LIFLLPLRALLLLCVLRTDGSLKAALPLLQIAAFIGAALCGINDLHGYAVQLLSVCESSPGDRTRPLSLETFHKKG